MWRRSGRASRSSRSGLVGAEELAGREQQRRAGAGQDVGWPRWRCSGCSAARARRRRSAWPGTRPPSARCSATRSRPGPRRRRPGRSSPRRPAGPRRATRRRSAADPSVDQRVVVGELVGNPVQDLRNGPRIVPCPRACPVIDAPLTKQVLGRLAYKGDRGPGVQGRGPRLARRQSRRRIRRAQGPRRAGPRGRGVRGTAGVEPAPGGRRSDLPGLAGGARRPRPVGRAPRRVLRGVRPRRRARQGQPLRRGTARADADRLRHARSSSSASCRRSSTSPSCGARATPSPAPAATWPTCRPRPSSTATSG